MRAKVLPFCLWGMATALLLLQVMVANFSNIREMQNGLLSDDHLSFITKAIQMRECPREECDAIALAGHYSDYDSKNKKLRLLNIQKWREKHFISHIYQPIYVWCLGKISEITGAYRSAYWLLYALGSAFQILAISVFTMMLFGPWIATLTEIWYTFSPPFYSNWSVSVPWTVSAALFLLLLSFIIIRRRYAIWSLPIWAILMAGLHMMGVIFTLVAAVFIYKSGPLSQRYRLWLIFSLCVSSSVLWLPPLLGFANFRGDGMTSIFSSDYVALLGIAAGELPTFASVQFYLAILSTFLILQNSTTSPSRTLLNVLGAVVAISFLHQIDGYPLQLFSRIYFMFLLVLYPTMLSILVQIRKPLWNILPALVIGLALFGQSKFSLRSIAWADGLFEFSEGLIGSEQIRIVTSEKPCGDLLYEDQIVFFNFLTTSALHCRSAPSYFLDETEYVQEISKLSVKFLLTLNPLLKVNRALLSIKPGVDMNLNFAKAEGVVFLELRGPLHKAASVRMVKEADGRAEEEIHKVTNRSKFAIGPIEKPTRLKVSSDAPVILEGLVFQDSKYHFPWGRDVTMSLGDKVFEMSKFSPQRLDRALGYLDLVSDEGISLLFKRRDNN